MPDEQKKEGEKPEKEKKAGMRVLAFKTGMMVPDGAVHLHTQFMQDSQNGYILHYFLCFTDKEGFPIDAPVSLEDQKKKEKDDII